ncbi:MAG: methylenetetrahydrofolate reductase [NAD(P)H] [Alphaproteobacteria bacterium CG_4_9_14_3_um_filter_47_13]|nr:MAG: methylenetetrahydrofolate reductase [NAD(P)H] [Alphaproteobacteria bacterium CG_4_9_14_3_um_filter_47_13]
MPETQYKTRQEALPTLSFEYFPPKTYEAWETLTTDTAVRLAALHPSFMTVTYGAGGSRRSWTMETAVAIQKNTAIPTATHLTCINVYKKGLLGIAQTFQDNGIKHIVALRGDVPPEDAPLDYDDKNYYHYANELIAGLKSIHDFEISVAAYPEKHPEAPDMATDLQNLKRKWKTGADRAITQFFFDNNYYYDFLEKVETAGIKLPVIPGVLPIASYERMLRFAAMCHTHVPDKIKERFAPYFHSQEDMDKVATEILIEQIEGLMQYGVPHIHFYTLNKAEMTLAACKACGLSGKYEQKI